MAPQTSSVKRDVLFKRRRLLIKSEQESEHIENDHSTPQARSIPPADFTVLVLNSSHMVAKEITMELTLSIPGCSIMYAPTIALAKLLLARRKINLIVSCPLLPDGSIAALQSSLSAMSNRPDLVVVGEFNDRNTGLLKGSGYQMQKVHKLPTAPVRSETPPTPVIVRNRNRSSFEKEERHLESSIKNLGADLRNDLNNPLQAIVAMVFVAQAGGQTSPATIQALDAIDQAAKNLASVVKGIEDKILKAVNV